MADLAHHVADVAKYTKDVDQQAVAGIIRHCGIALRSRDASLVAGDDKEELDLVRKSFLKKKLGLDGGDAELDAAIKSVITQMKAAHSKSRVTVYYLLAEHYGKLGAFGGALQAQPTS